MELVVSPNLVLPRIFSAYPTGAWCLTPSPIHPPRGSNEASDTYTPNPPNDPTSCDPSQGRSSCLRPVHKLCKNSVASTSLQSSFHSGNTRAGTVYCVACRQNRMKTMIWFGLSIISTRCVATSPPFSARRSNQRRSSLVPIFLLELPESVVMNSEAYAAPGQSPQHHTSFRRNF